MPLTVALLLLGGNAFADTYTIDVEGGPNNQGLDTTRGESIWMQENGVNESQFFVGVLFITLTDTNGGVWYRDTVCVDLFTEINIDSTYGTTILSPADVPGKTNLNRVAWLVDNAMLPVNNTNYVSQLPSSDWVTNAAQGAGIQLAIWDITVDNGDGLSTGSVQASSDPANPTPAAVIYWATNYEALSLGKSSYSAYVYNNVNMGNGQPAQMLLGPIFTDNGPATTFSIGNLVFKDNGAGGGTANNGIRDGTEPGIAKILMDIYATDGSGNPTGSVLATTITDAKGYYRFDGLPAGTYVVVVDVIGSGTNLNGMITSTGWSTNLTLAGDLRDHGIDAPMATFSVLPGGIASVPVTVGIGLQPTNEATSGSGAGANGPSGDVSDNLTVDFGFFNPSPTAAVLAWLGAYVDANGQVRVTWQTLSEDHLLYFDVLRSAPSGVATDVTPEWVDSLGGQDSGFLYDVPDGTAKLPGKYSYCLVGWNDDGSSNVLANVTVTLAANASMSVIRITGLRAQANGMLVQWVGGQPPYTLEFSRQYGSGATWTPVGPAQPGETEAVVPVEDASGFFRVKSSGNE